MKKKEKLTPQTLVERFEGDLVYVASSSDDSIIGTRLIIGRNKREFIERLEKVLNSECHEVEEATDFLRSLEFYTYNLSNEDRVDIEDPDLTPNGFSVNFNFPEA